MLSFQLPQSSIIPILNAAQLFDSCKVWKQKQIDDVDDDDDDEAKIF